MPGLAKLVVSVIGAPTSEFSESNLQCPTGSFAKIDALKVRIDKRVATFVFIFTASLFQFFD